MNGWVVAARNLIISCGPVLHAGGVAEFFETAHDYVQEWSILDSDDEGGDRSQQSYARSTAVARVGNDASHSRGGRVRRRRGGKASASSARRNRVSRRSNAPLPPPDDGPRRLPSWVVCSPSWLPNPNSVGPLLFFFIIIFLLFFSFFLCLRFAQSSLPDDTPGYSTPMTVSFRSNRRRLTPRFPAAARHTENTRSSPTSNSRSPCRRCVRACVVVVV